LGKSLWPKGEYAIKGRVVTAMSLLVVGKLLNIQVPIYFKEVVDSINTTPGISVATAAGAAIIGYGAARTGSYLFSEMRNAVFAAVAQKAIRASAGNLFSHLHSLDLHFHLSRETGGLSRALDRGLKYLSVIANECDTY